MYHLTKSQATEVLESFVLTRKLVADLKALPVVLEGAEAVSNVPNPTKLVEAEATGIVATAHNPGKAAQCAPSAVTVIRANVLEQVKSAPGYEGSTMQKAVEAYEATKTPQQEAIAASVQTLRLTLDSDGATTMSSLELVEFLNSIRPAGDKELRHDNFMVKVPTIIGAGLAPKFLGSNEFTNGKGGTQTRKVYNLPRTEAAMMAMSYSPDLMREVMNAWDAAERGMKAKDITPAIPTTFAEALFLAAKLEEEKQAVTLRTVAPVGPTTLVFGRCKHPVRDRRRYRRAKHVVDCWGDTLPLHHEQGAFNDTGLDQVHAAVWDGHGELTYRA